MKKDVGKGNTVVSKVQQAPLIQTPKPNPKVFVYKQESANTNGGKGKKK